MTETHETIVALVTAFCGHRKLCDSTRFTVADSLEDAIRVVSLKGPDPRWKKIYSRSAPGDLPESVAARRTVGADAVVYEYILKREERQRTRWRIDGRPWFLQRVIVCAYHWSRFSACMRQAHELGLGWVVPANREVLIVPRPAVRSLDGRPAALHDDTGHKAIEWHDGSGYYFLHGTDFERQLYFDVINGELGIQKVAALENADRRSIALMYMGFQKLVAESGAQLLDTGVKGTSLYRLPLPQRLAADRASDYGHFDYFIHMRDASHPEREFIEWVDPRFGEQRNAELCQARAFGISLEEWLSIEQEG